MAGGHENTKEVIFQGGGRNMTSLNNEPTGKRPGQAGTFAA